MFELGRMINLYKESMHINRLIIRRDEIMQLKDVEEISTQNQVDIQFEENIYSFQIEIRSNQVLEVQMDQDGNILEWMTKTKEEM